MNGSKLVCDNCASEEFYEDEQGFSVCVYCGQQSQDVFAEDFEMGEMERANRFRRRSTVRRRTLPPQKRGPTVEDFLRIYQYALKLFATRVSELACATGGASSSSSSNHTSATTDPLVLQCKTWWFAYVEKLHLDGVRTKAALLGTPITADASEHTIPRPSKFILLGIIYLACRSLRSWVLPSTLARWAQDGSFPYMTLWEAVPAAVRGRVDIRYMSLLNAEHGGPTYAPTAHTVLFHANFVCEYLGAPFPAINAPLVARTMVAQLGLPYEVWTHFVRLTRVLMGERAFSPQFALHASAMQHPEQVMAIVVMACKCSHRWMDWVLERERELRAEGNIGAPPLRSAVASSSTSTSTLTSSTSTAERFGGEGNSAGVFVSIPTDLVDSDEITRRDLPRYLERYTALVKAYKLRANPPAGRSDFNAPIALVAREQTLTLNKPLERSFVFRHPQVMGPARVPARSVGESESDASDMCASRGLARALAQMSEDALAKGATDSDKDDEYLVGARGAGVHADETQVRPYMTYAGWGDHTGTLHLEYATLIERCARHIMVAPASLHALVQKLDTELMQRAHQEAKKNVVDADKAKQLRRRRKEKREEKAKRKEERREARKREKKMRKIRVSMGEEELAMEPEITVETRKLPTRAEFLQRDRRESRNQWKRQLHEAAVEFSVTIPAAHRAGLQAARDKELTSLWEVPSGVSGGGGSWTIMDGTEDDLHGTAARGGDGEESAEEEAAEFDADTQPPEAAPSSSSSVPSSSSSSSSSSSPSSDSDPEPGEDSITRNSQSLRLPIVSQHYGDILTEVEMPPDFFAEDEDDIDAAWRK